jgi:hypothetical protein
MNRKKLVNALKRRAGIVVRACKARPHRQPLSLRRATRALLGVVLSLLISTNLPNLQVTWRVIFTPCGDHPARGLD